MNMNTRIQIAISSAVAGLALLGLSAVPAFARNHDRLVIPSASGTAPTQAQSLPNETQMNQMKVEKMQQMNQMMERCNSMMSMMQKMMGSDNMPGMMNNQNNRPGQNMMNRTPRQ